MEVHFVFFVRSAALLTAVYAVVGIAERRPALRFRPLTTPRPHLLTDIAWYGVAIAATAVSAFVLQPVLARFAIGPLADRVAPLPLVAKLAIGIVVFDLVSFLVHRRLHRSDALWSFHKVHHSSLELDGFATTRTHMFENLLRFVPGQLALYLVGIPVAAVSLTVAIAAVYGVSNHSNLAIRAPWLEALLVTPRLHRRHHVPATTMNNYGTILTIWDRMAGTLVRMDTRDDDRYGVPGEIDTYPQRFADAARQPFAETKQRRAELATR
jgi:sterol desaturase/sphingolipid hydroxylase (fatty acid hydroxylase superfamily)